LSDKLAAKVLSTTLEIEMICVVDHVYHLYHAYDSPHCQRM